MSVTAIQLKKFAPEFCDYDNGRLQLFIRMAERQINQKVFGCTYEDAVVLLSLHMATMFSREGAGGAITSEKVGDLQVNYSSPSSEVKSNLTSTSYGQLFWDLMTATRGVPLVLGC